MGIEYNTSDDPREAHLKAVGDTSKLDVWHTNILVALYVPPKTSRGGIILTEKTRDTEKWQSKVGLVIKKGPNAFVDDAKSSFNGLNVEVGDWIYFRPGDAWPISVNGVDCRIIDNEYLVKGKVSEPNMLV